jgi:hypothetical protein
MEMLSQFACMCLADGALAIEHVRNHGARSKYGNQIALSNSSIFHQDARSGSTGSAWPSGYFVSLNWRTKVKLAYQRRDEFSEALFLWRERLA